LLLQKQDTHLSNSEKVKILKDFLGSYNKTGQECLFTCPKCNHHKKKLSVNIDKDVFKCWICDYRGNSIYRLVRKYASYEKRSKWQELSGKLNLLDFENILESIFPQNEPEEEIIVDLPSEFVSLANKNNSIEAKIAKNYLNKRNITDKDILFWKIGYCSSGEYAGRVIIPSFNESGDCNFFIARTYRDDWRKYMNPPTSKSKIIFNELYIDWCEDLTLTEGVFDAIVAGKNSVPILGSSLKEQSKLFKSIIMNETPVYVALDSDAEEKASFLIQNLIKYDAEVYKVDVFPYSDVGEMPKKEFLKRKKAARLMSSEDAYLQKFINSFNF
jgi:DNA primase